MLQQLWLEKLSWDEALPSSIHTSWSEFRRELPCLNSLTIKRHVICHDPVRIEMHGFSDASKRAYGTCVFIKSVDKNGQTSVDLICAKTKVAPLKTVTLPRLELSGALVLARLAKKVSDSLRIRIDQRIFWTDSTIVLVCIKTTPNKLKTFVNHRVAETQDLTCSDTWRYVPSADNPADILLRGAKPRDLKDLSLWWHGPHWLKKDDLEWPFNSQFKGEEVPEMRKIVQTLVATSIPSFPFERFSKVEKLKRVTAWLFRFKTNCKLSKNDRHHGKLTLIEVNDAFKCLIKIAQRESFPNEIDTLIKSKEIERKSRLLSLSPFLDNEGIIRVGGRIQNSNFATDKKHPILLCSKHYLTKLLMENEHIKLLHSGPQLTLTSMREKFWPILGRKLANRVVRQCLICFRHNPKGVQPIMSSLPESRLRPGPVFYITGVDYADPFQFKDKRGRGAKLSKCYVGLFICFAVKAVHLELITDLTKDSFILALKRFVARRGKPLQIFSDNGTNFVSANSELRKFVQNFGDQLSDEFSRENIEWKFIPASSPHFGGLWEAGVKSCKHHLKRVLGDTHLTFEEFYSLLLQIEAVLNSRPLFPRSSDPNDLVPLTPGHFLVGRPLTSLPEADVTNINTGRLSRFQHIQQMQQHFWKRWQREYVAELQQRVRWKTTKGELKLDAMVLIKEDNALPLRWRLGRIVRLVPGLDGINRVAIIKTKGGEIRRSFAKICPLPAGEESLSNLGRSSPCIIPRPGTCWESRIVVRAPH